MRADQEQVKAAHSEQQGGARQGARARDKWGQSGDHAVRRIELGPFCSPCIKGLCQADHGELGPFCSPCIKGLCQADHGELGPFCSPCIKGLCQADLVVSKALL